MAVVAATRPASAQLDLGAWPTDRVFQADTLELPARLRGDPDRPLTCTVQTILSEYRPNQTAATLHSHQRTVTLRPGEIADVSVRLAAPAPGPYHFRLAVSTGNELLAQQEGTLLYRPQSWALPNLEPRDFDAFWQSTLAEMRTRPLEVKWHEAGEKPAPEPFREISFTGLGNRRIRGYLGIPPQLKPGQKAPAILSLPSASYHSAAVDLKAVEQGYVFLALSIHDMPFGGDSYRTHPKPHWFAEEYQGIGRQSKETFYYRAAYVAGPRAIDFLRSLPQVDPRKIVVSGMSQGGSLALATAALQPDIALAEADVPGRSRMDLLTTTYKANMSLPPPAGMTAWEMFEKTLAYFDVSYFARRIRCPIVMRMSLDDPVNPGPLQYWAFLQLKQSPDARNVLMPGLKHQTPPDREGHGAAMRQKYAPPAR
jgi:cephalosporin-C deacetylase